MKTLVILGIWTLALSNAVLSIERLTIGQSCNSIGYFTISNFTITPYPPTTCAPQAIAMIGTFATAVCPNEILVNQIYNHQQSDNQINILTSCYTAGQAKTFYFDVYTPQCNTGLYQIQVTLQGQVNQQYQSLSCWEYAYTIT